LVQGGFHPALRSNKNVVGILSDRNPPGLKPSSVATEISTPCGFQMGCYALVMGKFKVPATGEGYLGEVMVHRISRAVGIVENVIEAKAGWSPQISLKLKDGSVKKGKLSDFREPTAAERESIPTA